jgi:hypothetical protein
VTTTDDSADSSNYVDSASRHASSERLNALLDLTTLPPPPSSTATTLAPSSATTTSVIALTTTTMTTTTTTLASTLLPTGLTTAPIASTCYDNGILVCVSLLSIRDLCMSFKSQDVESGATRWRFVARRKVIFCLLLLLLFRCVL